jgi:hypothetical protein
MRQGEALEKKEVDEEGEDELDDEAEDEQEGEAAVKLCVQRIIQLKRPFG